MASLTKKLYYAKNGTDKTIKLYAAKSDCLDTTTGPFLNIDLEGTIGYAGLVSGDGKGSYPSDMKVEYNGSTYTVQECGYHKITITQPSNGQIKITHNGSTYNTSFDAMMEGVYIVTATPNSGYKLTELKVDSTSISSGSSQTCSKAVTITATISAMTLSKYTGSISSLSYSPHGLAATNIGDYALFAGGYGSGGDTFSTVNAFNTSLTRSSPSGLSSTASYLGATRVGNYALFGGGYYYSENTTARNNVSAYNESLTKTSPSSNLSTARSRLSAASIGSYAIFGGGSTTSSVVATVDAYNTSLTRSTPTALSKARKNIAAASTLNYAVFAGGQTRNGTGDSATDAYNASLTRSNPATELISGSYSTSATVGDYILFCGSGTTVYAYNSSFTKSQLSSGLSGAGSGCAGTSIGNFAIFGGGASGDTLKNTVTVYNASLTRSVPTALNTSRYQFAATSVGNFAIFGGGKTRTSNPTYTSATDAYIIS